MIFILDNYDSFTYNLVQSVGKMGSDVFVKRNDQVNGSDVLSLKPDGVILSPGPGRPEEAGNMPEILSAIAGKIPVLGVCLGHQMIGLHFGGDVVAAAKLVHGKATRVFHDGRSIYRGLSDPFYAGRYHSLAVKEVTMPACLEISCRAEDGEVMGVRHKGLPIEGVQFHPESILTPEGDKLIANFLGWISTRRST